MKLPKKYGIIDNQVVLDNEFSAPARLLYAILCAYADKEFSCFPSVPTLATVMNVDKRTVKRYIKELRERKVIVRKQSRYNGSAVTQIQHGESYREGEYYTPKYIREIEEIDSMETEPFVINQLKLFAA